MYVPYEKDWSSISISFFQQDPGTEEAVAKEEAFQPNPDDRRAEKCYSSTKGRSRQQVARGLTQDDVEV